MNKEIIKRYNKTAKESKDLLYMLTLESAGMLNLAVEVNNPSVINAFSSITSFSLVIAFYLLGYNKEKINYMKEQLKVVNEDQYLDLKDMYNIYLDLLAELISSFSFNSVLELCIFLDYLKRDGYFSVTDNYNYKRFQQNNEIFKDLIGTTILTGQAVCRHETAFMNDLLTRLKVKNFTLYTYDMGEKKKLFRTYKSTHVLVGLVENNKVFGYDFTNHCFAKIEDKRTISLTNFITNELESYFSITNSYNIKDYLRLEAFDINTRHLGNLDTLTYVKYFELRNIFDEFKTNHMELMEEIASKNLILMPRK